MGPSVILRLLRKLNTFLTLTPIGRFALYQRIKTKLLIAAISIFPRPFIVSCPDEQLLYWGPVVLDPYTTELFKRALRPGATVLDIGAHRGYYSLIAAKKVGSRGKVYAFEPSPENFWFLRKNIDLNGFSNIHAIQKAVGDKDGKVILYYGRTPYQHSLVQTSGVFKDSKITVECISIDNFLNQAVDVVKMDIEGGELGALRGMKKTIARCQRLTMFVELNPRFLQGAGVEPLDLIAHLKGMGLEVYLIDEDIKQLIPVSKDDIQKKLAACPTWYANLYCLKS